MQCRECGSTEACMVCNGLGRIKVRFDVQVKNALLFTNGWAQCPVCMGSGIDHIQVS